MGFVDYGFTVGKKIIRYNIVNVQTAEKQLKDFNNTVENGKD